jgi:isocitrate dehydrogenase kinase/phosphatase
MISLAKLDPLAERSASAIETAFNAYQTEFKSITWRAKVRFEQRDWHGAQSTEWKKTPRRPYAAFN